MLLDVSWALKLSSLSQARGWRNGHPGVTSTVQIGKEPYFQIHRRLNWVSRIPSMHGSTFIPIARCVTSLVVGAGNAPYRVRLRVWV